MYIEKHIVNFPTSDVPSHVNAGTSPHLKINMAKGEPKPVGYDFAPTDSMREKAQNLDPLESVSIHAL